MKDIGETMFITQLINKKRIQEFRAGFDSIGTNSGFGILGYGDTCRIWDRRLISVGDNSWFGRDSVIQVISKYPVATDKLQPLDAFLTIGSNVHCTEKCRILCAGQMRIGNDVLIAPEVFICDNNHGMDPTVNNGYKDQPLSVENVIIEDGVWLGEGVYILPGVTVGAHSIVAARAVVTHDIPPFCMVGGTS